MGPREEESPLAQLKDHTPGGKGPPDLLSPLCIQKGFTQDGERQKKPLLLGKREVVGREETRESWRLSHPTPTPMLGFPGCRCNDKTTHREGWKGFRIPC